MSDIYLWKTPAGVLAPASEVDQDKLKRFKTGVMVRAEVKQVRNYQFLKKWFALIKFAYDQWSDTADVEYKGEKVSPNFETFRRDVTILAGYSHLIVHVDGSVRVEADSISFGSMDEETFEALYSKTIDVILGKILKGKNYTDEQLRNLVDQTMSFAG